MKEVPYKKNVQRKTKHLPIYKANLTITIVNTKHHTMTPTWFEWFASCSPNFWGWLSDASIVHSNRRFFGFAVPFLFMLWWFPFVKRDFSVFIDIFWGKTEKINSLFRIFCLTFVSVLKVLNSEYWIVFKWIKQTPYGKEKMTTMNEYKQHECTERTNENCKQK